MHQLPADIQQMVYDRLHACDRAKLYIALPKQSRRDLRVQPSYKECALTVLSRAIQKHKVKRLSYAMLNFLKDCDKDDPTCAPIIEAFPEVAKTMKCKSILNHKPSSTFYDKIFENSLTEADAKVITLDYFYATRYTVARFSLDTFKLLYQHSTAFCEYIKDISKYLSDVSTAYNVDLVNELLENKEKYDITNDILTYYRRCVVNFYTVSWKYLSDTYLAHINFTKEELEKVYENVLDLMDIKSAEKIEKVLKIM